MWTWLGSNSAQIQALAGIAAVLVATIVGWVAWKQKLAAEAQARAAGQQTAAAFVQAEAAREQVTAANQQTKTSLAIADKQTLPNFSITAGIAPNNQIVPGGITILNNGSGPAFNVTAQYKDGNEELGIGGRTLVISDSVTIKVDLIRAAQSGLLVRYKTTFGTKYVLEFSWNGQISQAVAVKLIAGE